MIEFALCLPLLLLLFAGAVDVTRMVLLHQKVSKAVYTLGDLTTQLDVEDGVCTYIKNWDQKVVKAILMPFDYDSGDFKVVVSSVLAVDKGGAKPSNRIEWQYNPQKVKSPQVGKMKKAYKQTATLPGALGNNTEYGERIIVTEMYYSFSPMLPGLTSLTGGEFSKIAYQRGRITRGMDAEGTGMLSGC